MKNLVQVSFLFLFFFGITISSGSSLALFSSLQVGDTAPLISSTDQFGIIINSDKILENEQILLIFYRGVWCPHCMKHLKLLQESLNDIEATGTKVVVVTPEQPPFIKATMKKTGASFSILTDPSYRIMEAYGVSFKLNENNTSNYVLSNTRKGNGNKDDVLPVPATYIIGKDKKIRYVHYDPNYRNRSSIEEIMNYLKLK